MLASRVMRLLLLEDDPILGEGLRDFLRVEGHGVDWFQRLGDAMLMAGEPYDALLVDWQLPDGSGIDWVRTLRRRGLSTPILMLTARDTLEDKLRGFAEGADDYLVKPFEMRELEARIHAVRRHRQPSGGALAFAGLTYDPRTMTAQRDTRRIPLTRLQGSLLAVLLQEAPRIVPHARLIDTAWGVDGGDIAALQTQVYELRALVDKPFAQPLIHTVRGIGYRLASPA